MNSLPSGIGLVCCGYHPWSAIWKRNQSLYWSLATRPWVGRSLFINPLTPVRHLWRGGSAQSEIQRTALRRGVWPRRVGSPGRPTISGSLWVAGMS